MGTILMQGGELMMNVANPRPSDHRLEIKVARLQDACWWSEFKSVQKVRVQGQSGILAKPSI